MATDPVRARDLTARPVRLLLRRLAGREAEITSSRSVSESQVDYAVTIVDGDSRWLGAVSARVAPYDRGCGQLHLALLDAAGERVEVGHAYTVASGRTGAGPRWRPLLRRVGLERLYADELSLAAGQLGALREELACAVAKHGVEYIMPGQALEIGDRSRLSPLAE